jgi:hypothetical protein
MIRSKLGIGPHRLLLIKLAYYFYHDTIFLLFELPYTDFLIGDVLLRRRYVTGSVAFRRRSVYETFCMETFCRGDVLYVRPSIFHM